MKYAISSQVHYQDLDGEVVILDGHSDKYLGLNKSGALIWRVLAKGGSPADAIQCLMETYGISRQQSESDVHQLLSELLRNRLLQPVGP